MWTTRSMPCDCPTVDGDGQLGAPGKTAATAFEVSCRGWHVAGMVFWGHNYWSALSVFSRHLCNFTCTLSPGLTPLTQFHCTATTAYTTSDCNWRWHAVSVHFSGDAWSEHSAWRYGLSHARRPSAAAGPSYLLSASSSLIGSNEIWNPYTVATVATSERLNQQTIWCNRDGCGVARLEAFLYIQNCKFLTYVDVIKDAKQRMRTQNSGIHTSLVVAIRRGKMMRCEVSLNNKRRPSILLHVVGVTSSRGPHLTGRLTLTVRRGDEYSATCCQACTH